MYTQVVILHPLFYSALKRATFSAWLEYGCCIRRYPTRNTGLCDRVPNEYDALSSVRDGPFVQSASRALYAENIQSGSALCRCFALATPLIHGGPLALSFFFLLMVQREVYCMRQAYTVNTRDFSHDISRWSEINAATAVFEHTTSSMSGK